MIIISIWPKPRFRAKRPSCPWPEINFIWSFKSTWTRTCRRRFRPSPSMTKTGGGSRRVKKNRRGIRWQFQRRRLKKTTSQANNNAIAFYFTPQLSRKGRQKLNFSHKFNIWKENFLFFLFSPGLNNWCRSVTFPSRFEWCILYTVTPL